MVDDKSLFCSIASSDEQAFRTIFERYRLPVYKAAMRWTKSASAAEDITQEVFIKLWERRDLLATVNYPKAYIYKVTFNHTSNYIRKKELQSKAISILGQRPVEVINSAEELLEAKECEQRISEAVGRLSSQKQTVYNLSKNVGKSYKEIAESLKISPETVRSHLYEAMKFIRHYLKSGLVIGLLILLQSLL